MLQHVVRGTAERVGRLLRSQAQLFDLHARRAALRLTPDGVHDLRVLLRRIRAAVWIVARLGAAGDVRGLRRSLRRLGRALGERRLLDVAADDATAYGLDTAPLAQERERTGRAILKQLRPDRRAKLVARLRAAAAVMPAGDGLPAALAARARRLESALARAHRSARDMHLLRIELKKARYILEALDRDAAFIKPLQDAIGRAHDLDVMQQLVGRHPRAEQDRRRADRRSRARMKRVVARAAAELERP